MNQLTNLSVEVVVGGSLSDILLKPLPPYSTEALNFLTQLSGRLLKSAAIRKYADVMSFAYWCRPANLDSLARSSRESDRRIGRGIALHIAPANVPVNSAYSLVFGILAGNSNIVRISNSHHPQTEILYEVMSKILNNSEHARIRAMNCVIKYEHNDDISSTLSEISNVRLLWGGDKTINYFRRFKISPKCVDVCFSDRFSLCIIDAVAVLSVEEFDFSKLINDFYNDVYLHEQKACSSPHLVIWQGSSLNVLAAQNKFWGALRDFIGLRPQHPSIQAVDKYTHLCRSASLLPNSKANLEQSNYVFRLILEAPPANIDEFGGQYGFFCECIDNELTCLNKIVNERYQTVTYFGIDPQRVVDKVREAGLTGIDRVVPIGKALEIGVFWDGYDVISSLTRFIEMK
jgi:hypothetical protein